MVTLENKSHVPANLPRDIFLYILNFGMLYASVVACIELLFRYAEVRFPDPLTFSFTAASGGIRTAASVLLVTYPVFLVSSWFIRKIIRGRPEAAEFKPRKWLTYLTLFASGVTLIIDLIVLFNTFWSGEITTRFIVKVCVILIIGAALLAYFAWELRNTKEHSRVRIILGWGTLAFVFASIVAGFFIIGSPAAQRERRFDDIRLQDLDSLYWQIISYYQTNAVLPKTLHDLETHNAGFVLPKDPETQKDYEYEQNDNKMFELCAVFFASSVNGANTSVVYPASDPLRAWMHAAGRSCFSQEVSPDMIQKNSLLKSLAPPTIRP